MGSRLAAISISGAFSRQRSAIQNGKLFYTKFVASIEQEASTSASSIKGKEAATSTTSSYETKRLEHQQYVLRMKAVCHMLW